MSTKSDANKASVGIDDSGVATSHDANSLEYDEPEWNVTPAHFHPLKGQASRISSLSSNHKTLEQHYYPEGGWGWLIVAIALLVQALTVGLQLGFGVVLIKLSTQFAVTSAFISGWVGAMSTGVALFISPLTIGVCKRKSTRLTAVIGGLVTALGCLFTSFASQFHQVFLSYGAIVGVGVGMTRDCSFIMVAQYFKRRRELVEIFIVSGSGIGISVMSVFIKAAIDSWGWRLGLQAVTGTVFLTFFLGTFYRSASLYHPQRRAILHLKNQKRKIKDKNRVDDRPPFFDFSTLKSKTVQIVLASSGLSAFGITTPIFYLAHIITTESDLKDKVVTLQMFLGIAWTCGCVVFGMLVVQNNVECQVARRYLCQASSFLCGLSIIGLTLVNGNYQGYVMFVWIYGIFCGGYSYSLKMYTYEKVRARNFVRAWSFVQCSQGIPIALGVPITGYLNGLSGGKIGFYFSAICVLIGSLLMFLIDVHKKNVLRHKHHGALHVCVSDSCPQKRKLSFSQEPDNEPGLVGAGAALMLGTDLLMPQNSDKIVEPVLGLDKNELTCISEEGIADMDLPDNVLDEFCITSCNKVENYLMLSEFENNLNAELPFIEKKSKRSDIHSKVRVLFAKHDLEAGKHSTHSNDTASNADEAVF